MFERGRGWRLRGNNWTIGLVFGQHATGKIEMVNDLATGHPSGDQLRLRLGRWNVSGKLALRVELSPALGSRDALNLAGMGQFTAVFYKPPFAVGRSANAGCRCANEQY
jgi:hypothetical protein